MPTALFRSLTAPGLLASLALLSACGGSASPSVPASVASVSGANAGSTASGASGANGASAANSGASANAGSRASAASGANVSGVSGANAGSSASGVSGANAGPSGSSASSSATGVGGTGATAGASTSAGATQTLTFGTFGSTGDAALYSAVDNGYFKAEGLSIQLVPFTQAPDVIGFLAGGKMDAANTSATPGFFNAVGEGIGIKMAAASGQIDPTHNNVGLVVLKKDAAKYKSLADLKGATIASTDWSGTSGAELGLALKNAGLSPSDINLKSGPPANNLTALCNGSVAGAVLIEPFLYTAQAKDCGQLLLGFGNVLPHGQNGAIIFSEKVAGNADLSSRVLRAILKGQKDYMAAFPTDGSPPKGRDRMVQLLIAHTPIKDSALYDKMQPTAFPADGKVDVASTDYFQQFFAAQGLQKKVIPDADYLLDWSKLDLKPR